MIKFDEQKQLDSTAGALAIRKEIERIAEDVAGRGYSNLCYLGIGGTYASALQAQSHVQENSGMEIIAQNAALYNTTGNRRIGENTVVVLSSVTGTTTPSCSAFSKNSRVRLDCEVMSKSNMPMMRFSGSMAFWPMCR